MKIEEAKAGSIYRLTLEGRLDASWRAHLEEAIERAIRGGEHHLRLDMAAVEYISSAGIRLLMQTYRKLKGIGGSMQIEHPSELTENVLRMSGLTQLIAEPESNAPTNLSAAARIVESASARFEFYPETNAQPVAAKGLGDVASLSSGATEFIPFTSPAVMLGIGAIGKDDAAARMGELIAVNGNVAYQPTDGANQPDYVAPHGDYKADGQMLLGIAADQLPGRLARFESPSVIGQTVLAQTILDEAKADAVMIVAVTETAGLVGATLRQSPAKPGTTEERFGFPGLREWLSYSTERVHHDTTSLIVGFIAKPGTPIDAYLRPLGDGLMSHCHAAVFPYHPLRKGNIALGETVDATFNEQRLLAVTHLLSDQRDLVGAGESEFYRGAVWYAPLTF